MTIVAGKTQNGNKDRSEFREKLIRKGKCHRNDMDPDKWTAYFNGDTCDESVDLSLLVAATDNICKSSPFRPTPEGIFACAAKRNAGEKFDMKTVVIALLDSIDQLHGIPDKKLVALHEAGHAVVMLALDPDNLLFTSLYGYTANIDEGGINGAIAGLGGVAAAKTDFGGTIDEMQVRQILNGFPASERPAYDECRRKAEEICAQNRRLIEAVAEELEKREVLTNYEIREIQNLLKS